MYFGFLVNCPFKYVLSYFLVSSPVFPAFNHSSSAFMPVVESHPSNTNTAKGKISITCRATAVNLTTQSEVMRAVVLVRSWESSLLGAVVGVYTVMANYQAG